MVSSSIEKIKIDCAIIYLLEKDIIHIEYTNDYFVELNDVVEVNNIYEKLSNGKPIYSILNSQGKFTSFSKEAQQYLAKDAPIVKNKIMMASALIVDSLSTRLLGNFFLKFHKPNYPIKILKSEEEALKWINNFRHKIH